MSHNRFSLTSSVSRILLPVIILFILLMTGCRQDPYPRWEVEQTVRAYNWGVAQYHRTGESTTLEDFAGKREYWRVRTLAALNNGAGKRLESSAQSITFEKVDSVAPSIWEAVSHEKWVYRTVDAKSGEPLENATEQDFRMLYRVVRREGKLVVQKVSFYDRRTEAEGWDPYPLSPEWED